VVDERLWFDINRIFERFKGVLAGIIEKTPLLKEERYVVFSSSLI